MNPKKAKLWAKLRAKLYPLNFGLNRTKLSLQLIDIVKEKSLVGAKPV
jgi:hypothetical protein